MKETDDNCLPDEKARFAFYPGSNHLGCYDRTGKNRNLKDDRIRAFIAFSPALGQGFPGEEQVKGISDPILFIGAENDRIAPIVNNAAHYHRLISHSEYIEIKGEAGHYIFLNEGDASLKKEAKYAYKDPAGVDRNQTHQQVIRIAIGFFAASFDKTK